MSASTFVPDQALSFTPTAIEHLRKRLQGDNAGQAIRVSVKPSGCSGYAYVLDTVDHARDTDMVLQVADALTVYVDHDSLPMIRGMEVDYVKEGINRTLQFRNPNVTGQCGCGESFTVKPQ